MTRKPSRNFRLTKTGTWQVWDGKRWVDCDPKHDQANKKVFFGLCRCRC